MNDTPEYKPGQQVYVATFRSKPYRDERSTITLDVIETDGGGHVVLVNGGVYRKEQVSTCPLQVINWLREKIEQEIGHLAVLSHKLTLITCACWPKPLISTTRLSGTLPR